MSDSDDREFTINRCGQCARCRAIHGISREAVVNLSCRARAFCADCVDLVKLAEQAFLAPYGIGDSRPWSVRAANALLCLGIGTRSELLTVQRKWLLRLWHVGKRTADEIMNAQARLAVGNHLPTEIQPEEWIGAA